MRLKTVLADRGEGSGTPGRGAQRLTLEAEAGRDAELLGELAVLLATLGTTTAAAVKELVAKATPVLDLD